MSSKTAKNKVEYYVSEQPILLAVDCVIFGFDQNKLKLLLFEREVNPLAGQWSLIGSFVRNDEGIRDAAQRVLSELTGLEHIYMEQLRSFGKVDRDNGGRVVSIVYWSFIKIENEPDYKIANHRSQWFDIGEIPDLVLDHNEMVQVAIDTLREKARYKPIGFELIPKEFSLPQLLKVYEAIFQRDIDDRNFRKKILKSGLLERTDKKDMTKSKKGSFLYRFNHYMYQQLLRDGYNFEI